jgi:hypothetical protein
MKGNAMTIQSDAWMAACLNGKSVTFLDYLFNARSKGWTFRPSNDPGMRVEFRNPKSLCTFSTNGTIENALWHIWEYDLLEEYGYAENFGQCAFCEYNGQLYSGPRFAGNACEQCVSEM